MRTGIAVLMAASLLTACAADDPERRAKTGAVVGGVVGGVVGHQVDEESGRYVGAVTGAIAGAAVGSYMDKQQREMERKLAEERRRNEIEVERVREDTLKLSLTNEVSFPFDSAELKQEFKPSLEEMAEVLTEYDKTRIRVVGHTDSIGAAGYNEQLSLRRADAVADYLADQGVDRSRLFIEGEGESEPVTTNATAEGRAANRRVELFINPITEEAQQRG